MKAIRIHKHGGLEVLRIDDIELPRLSAGQVLIKIKTAALNHLDLWVREGIPGVSLPIIMGSDAAGVVWETTAGSKFNKGDEVIIAPLHSCGECEACRAGRENMCREFKIRGESYPGVMSEYVAVEERYVFPKPTVLSWEESASFPLASLTAYHMLRDKVGLQPGQSILVYGASSGVGSAAVQLAGAMGATVITTAGGEEKVEQAYKLGADHVINYRTQPVGKMVRQLTGGQGVDVVFEHTGQQTWNDSLRALKFAGKIVTCGATTGPYVKIDLRALFIKHQQIIGSTMGTLQNLRQVIRMIEEGKYRPVMDRIFSYTQVKEAHDRLQQGRQFGKVVLSFS